MSVWAAADCLLSYFLISTAYFKAETSLKVHLRSISFSRSDPRIFPAEARGHRHSHTAMDTVMRLLWGWDPRIHAPDQFGKTCVVTGANSGLGFETALRLAERRATVLMAVRNLEGGNRAAETIRHRVHGAKLLVWHVDMGSFRSIWAFASRVRASFPGGVHALINNAGMLNPRGHIEVTRAINFFGPALLTHLLLPTLAAAAPSRVVNVSSFGEVFGSLDMSDIKGLQQRGAGLHAFGTAKADDDHVGQGDAAQAGIVHTPGEWKTAPGRLSSWTAWLSALVVGQPVSWGATSMLFAATEPRLASRGGVFIGPRYLHLPLGYAGSNTAVRTPVNPAAHDPLAARRLFDVTTAVLAGTLAKVEGKGTARPGPGAADAAGGYVLPSPDTLVAKAAAHLGPLGQAGASGLAPAGVVASDMMAPPGTVGTGGAGDEDQAMREALMGAAELVAEEVAAAQDMAAKEVTATVGLMMAAAVADEMFE